MTVKDTKQLNRTKHVDWNEHSRVLLGSLQRKEKNQIGAIGKHDMKFQPLNTVEKVMCCPDIQLAMLLTADQEKGECDGMLQEATRFF